MWKCECFFKDINIDLLENEKKYSLFVQYIRRTNCLMMKVYVSITKYVIKSNGTNPNLNYLKSSTQT